MDPAVALACCALLAHALDELAARGLESDDRPRLLVDAIRGAALGQRPGEDVEAAWGALYGRDRLPGPLDDLTHGAMMASGLMTQPSWKLDGWCEVLIGIVRRQVIAVLVAIGHTPEEAAAIWAQGYEQALGVAA